MDRILIMRGGCSRRELAEAMLLWEVRHRRMSRLKGREETMASLRELVGYLPSHVCLNSRLEGYVIFRL